MERKAPGQRFGPKSTTNQTFQANQEQEVTVRAQTDE